MYLLLESEEWATERLIEGQNAERTWTKERKWIERELKNSFYVEHKQLS